MKIDPNDFPTPDTWFRFHVSYGETDQSGVVYHANYLHWFERARSQFMRERGLPYSQVEARGIVMPIRQAYCRYLHPARYDQEVYVRCGVSKLGHASLIIVYQVWGPPEKSTLMAVGETELAVTNAEGRPVRLPDWLKKPFER